MHSVDLTSANFVHLVEPHWNPMVEEQALDRVHRMGQTRDVVATRYITNDSIETVRNFFLHIYEALGLRRFYMPRDNHANGIYQVCPRCQGGKAATHQ